MRKFVTFWIQKGWSTAINYLLIDYVLALVLVDVNKCCNHFEIIECLRLM